MARKERAWDPRFQRYMEFIINHPNYRGMPGIRTTNGEIAWICAGKSDLGKQREAWWRRRAGILGLSMDGKWIAKVAKANHPTKMKVCQVCGRELSIEYVYPTKNLIKRFNKIRGCEDLFCYEDFLPIDQIIRILVTRIGERAYRELSEIFHIPTGINKTETDYLAYIRQHYVTTESGHFSPGAMSNAPDRLDGFHSYNICCRSKEDTGRHTDNLSRYGEDRRAYEHWADGDWKSASWLMNRGGMGRCVLCEMDGDPSVKSISADHIGPISLGFTHLPIFQPLCRSHNSAKNNRMFHSDVIRLIDLERDSITYYRGNLTYEKTEPNQVASWHAEYIWDSLKREVHSDNDALELAKAMRLSHHYFLELLYSISVAGCKDYLLNYLHPEHAHFEYISFKNLDESTFSHDGVVRSPGTKGQYQNNAARYIRKAIQALEDYHQKENRRIKNIFTLTEIRQIQTMQDTLVERIRADARHNPELRRAMEAAFDGGSGDVIDKRILQLLRRPGGLNPSERNNEIDESILRYIRHIDDKIICMTNSL